MIKVIQVVENAAPDAAAQASAIRAGLDAAKFDAALVDATGMSTAELRRLFLDRRPRAVHAHGAGVRARVAAKAAGVGTILHTPHGYGFLSGDRPAARALEKLLERGAARIGSVVAASPSEAEQARRLGAARVAVVRDAYDGEFPEPLPHDDLLVASWGNMTPDQDPEAWVLLAQRLCDSRNGLRCLWLGGGPGEELARTNLNNMNLLMKVEVTGPIEAAAARERLRGADLFVRFSREARDCRAVLDAMARGLAVVASDLPAHRDAIEDGVTGFLVRSEVELLERCHQLVDDDALRAKLGAAGRERVKREHSRARQLDELSRLYAA